LQDGGFDGDEERIECGREQFGEQLARSRSALGGACRPHRGWGDGRARRPRPLRRRRSSGWTRWARELLRRDHEGSQERGGVCVSEV